MRQLHLYDLHTFASFWIIFSLIIDLVKVCTPSQETGWVPQHIVAEDDSGNVLGVIPLYLKRFVNFTIFHSLR